MQTKSVEHRLKIELEKSVQTKAWVKSTLFKKQISVKAHSVSSRGRFRIASAKFVTETVQNKKPSKDEEDEFYNSYF